VLSQHRSRRGVAAPLALLLAALCAFAALGDRAPAQEATQLQGKVDELEGVQAQQGGLESQIERHNAAIDDLIAEEAEVREREAAVAEELAAAEARLDEATAEVDRKRERLRVLRDRLARARQLLRETLVRMYKADSPDTLSMIMESATWSDVLAQAEYLDRIQSYDAAVIARVEALAGEVEATVERLEAVREQIEDDRDAIAAQRDQLAATRSALASRHADLVAARAERRSSLNRLEGRERELQKDIQTAPPSDPAPPGSAAPPAGAPAPAGATATLVNGQAIPPANAPAAVRSAIEAGNRIVGRPYVWGGGHGSFDSSGYDCSGTVSYALHGGGFLSTPLDSTGLTAWGSPGAGSWISVYANSGHAYVVIAGLRLDTGGTEGGSGPTWSTSMRSPAGFVARHPDGY
jgi:cell wall-associated NlpC family hydrolase